MSSATSKGGEVIGLTRLRVEASESGYADAVLADLVRVASTPSGYAIIADLRMAGRTVTIKRTYPPVDPPNAWTSPDDLAACTLAGKPSGQTDKSGNPILGSGLGSNTTIFYLPADWPSPTDARSSTSDVLLYQMLLQACDQMRGVQDLSTTPLGEVPAVEAAAVIQFLNERRSAASTQPLVRP